LRAPGARDPVHNHAAIPAIAHHRDIGFDQDIGGDNAIGPRLPVAHGRGIDRRKRSRPVDTDIGNLPVGFHPDHRIRRGIHNPVVPGRTIDAGLREPAHTVRACPGLRDQGIHHAIDSRPRIAAVLANGVRGVVSAGIHEHNQQWPEAKPRRRPLR